MDLASNAEEATNAGNSATVQKSDTEEREDDNGEADAGQDNNTHKSSEGDMSDGENDEEVSRTPAAERKRKGGPLVSEDEAEVTPKKPSKKTPAKHAVSTPAAPAKSKRKQTYNFEELAKAEELTRQQELEVEKERLRYKRAKADIKLQREKNKHEFRTISLQAQKEVILEQMRAKAGMMGGIGMAAGPAGMGFAAGVGGMGFAAGDSGVELLPDPFQPQLRAFAGIDGQGDLDGAQ